MSYLEDSIDWQVIELVDNWLDSYVAPQYKTQPLAQDWARISKVIEELGEAISTMIGYTGQNPRKGVTSSKDEMLDELADTALTAIFAMHHFTKNSSTIRHVLAAKQAAIYTRMSEAIRNENLDIKMHNIG